MSNSLFLLHSRFCFFAFISSSSLPHAKSGVLALAWICILTLVALGAKRIR